MLILPLQYGRILDIELKIPPRPPCYSFVEVLFASWILIGYIQNIINFGFQLFFVCFVVSLIMHGMQKMQSGVVMAMTLMVVV
jgi:hypothetical protein